MSGWVHVDGDERCFECYAIEWESDDPKPCNTPTPDPASPCGYRYPDDDGTSCGSYPGVHVYGHPYQPTRCTCGHPIEERA